MNEEESKAKKNEPDIHVAKALKFATQLPFSEPVNYACMSLEAAIEQTKKKSKNWSLSWSSWVKVSTMQKQENHSIAA